MYYISYNNPMYSRFSRIIFPLYIFIFSFLIVSQLGKHFFFNFSYLSGIRIDYLAPTLYLSDLLSAPIIFFTLVHLFYKRASAYKWRLHTILFIVFLLILFLINFSFSLSKPLWIYGFVRCIQFLILFIFFRHQGNRKGIYSAVVWGILLGGFFELFLSMSQLSARHSLQGAWYYLGERSFSIFTPGIAKAYFLGREFLRPYGTFSHPNSLGGFYLLVFTFALTQRRITHPVIKIALLFVSSALVLVSFSRTAIMGYVLVSILYFVRTFATCKTCFFAKVTIGFFLILFALGISGDLNSFKKRTDFVEKSISIISQRPFTGTGIGGYLIAQHQYPQKFVPFFEQPVHNIFLLIIAQLGVPLTLLLFVSIFRKIDIRNRGWEFFLPFLCILITGNVDHYWITLQQNILVLAVISGILFSYEKKTP